MKDAVSNPTGNYIQEERKKAGLTQQASALRSGLGLGFIRDLEQGKKTVQMDKVKMFGSMAVPQKMPGDGKSILKGLPSKRFATFGTIKDKNDELKYGRNPDTLEIREGQGLCNKTIQEPLKGQRGNGSQAFQVRFYR